MKNNTAFNIALSSGKFACEQEYWLTQLSGELPVVGFPYDNIPLEVGGAQWAEARFAIQDTAAAKLINLSNKSNRRLLMALIAGVEALFYRYTREENVLILTPVETQAEGAEYLNTALILKNQLNGELSYKHLLLAVKDTLLAAEKHQNFPYGLICEQLHTTPAELLHIGVVLENMQKYEHLAEAECEITFAFRQEGEGISGCIYYAVQRYWQSTIERLACDLDRLLSQVVSNLEISLRELARLSAAERAEVLVRYNATAQEFPADETIYGLFLKSVQLHPEQTAVEMAGEQVTYEGLHRLACRVAHELRKQGVGPEQVVGIMANPSLALVSGVLGILQAGGAYLPLDPASPLERLRFYLEDSETEILLCAKDLLEVIPTSYTGTVISLDSVLEDDNSVECSKNRGEAGPENLAYLIYTSGSTGLPKGVMVEHRSVVNLLSWNNREKELRSADRGALFANISFDAAVLNIFTVLAAGATLVIVPPAVRQEPVRLTRWLKEERITVAGLSTRMGELVMQLDPELPLRIMYVGGEKLHPIQRVSYQVFNEYGPTENTVASTFYRFTETDPYHEPPIGKPVDNVQIYLLDADFEPVPVNVVGEIYLAGTGLARGYWQRPDLTENSFLPNPFTGDGKMYRTGDLGRWLPDGNLEFVGRRDSQIKLRGFRIEAGEIEALLLTHPDIKEAAVLLKEDGSDAYLTAYLAVSQPLKIKELRAFLQGYLPAYMIPDGYVFLEELPVTAHGKINQQALLQLSVMRADAANYVPPANAIEEELAAIWAAVLQLEKVGVVDHFFELGGHSLKAAKLITEVHRHFGVALTLQDIFAAPTVRELGARIQGGQVSAERVINPAPQQDDYPAASAQKRLYILWTMDPQQTNYNIPGAMLIEGTLQSERFEQAIRALLKRHDSFRTYFRLESGELRQSIAAKPVFAIEYGEAAGEEVSDLIRRFIRPFDLTQAPLLRVGLYRLTPDKYLFLTDMHHIISDGISMGILQREFVEVYNGKELEPLRLQYKDYAFWQEGLRASGELQSQAEFWSGEFAGEIPVLDLPTDYPRPGVLTHEGASAEHVLPARTSEALQELARVEGASLFMVLLALYAALLGRLARQDDLIVGFPADGRPTEETQKIIGMFVNTLPLRLQPAPNLTFAHFLGTVREKFFRVLANQEYQFEQLIEQLQITRNPGRNPLLDTMLNMQNWDMPANGMEIDGLNFRPLHFETTAVKFDLALNVALEGGLIRLSFDYNTNLFTQATIERILGYLALLAAEVTRNPLQQLQDYIFISQAEQQMLLYEFNQPLRPYSDARVTITQYFAEHAHTHPTDTALAFGDVCISYGELNSRANQLARRLKSCGVGPESIVALLVQRSVEMFIGLLAILKAGGAYLPVDPHYPSGRIQYTLTDSGAKLLMSQNMFSDIVQKVATGLAAEGNNSIEVLYLDDPSLYTGEEADLPLPNSPADLAYIIYTSGSTGKPKGVMIEHRNMVTALVRHQRYYPIERGSFYLHFTSYTFDASIYELFGWIIGGASVLVLKPGEEKDPTGILQSIRQYNVTHAHFVPSMLSILCTEVADEDMQALNNLRYLYVGGESISPETVKKFYAKTSGVALYNVYGPTETTIDATDFLIPRNQQYKTIPIGKPMENVQIYILTPNLQLQPVGVPGEICIGGYGVGRGYLERPELTADRFVANPFLPGEFIYRSGDLGRWLPDGSLEFLGRIDHQVKVRGFRIEPGEIENCLQSHEAIKTAIVVSKRNARGEAFLTAYLLSERDLSVEELHTYLLQFLPEYMVPAYFVRLEALPLLPSGKIDRQALPEPSGIVQTGTAYVAPRTELEQRLAELWKEVLGLEQVSIHDSFFQVGGTSLSIVRLYEKIKGLTAVQLTVADLFSYHTIAMCAEFMQSKTVDVQTEKPDLQYDDLLSKLANDELSPEEAARLFVDER